MNILNNETTISQYKKQILEKYPIDTDELGWRTYNPGECIYEQGYPISFLSLLVMGKVKIYSTSEEGRRLIVTFNKPLEIFGELELVQQVNTIHSIEAVTSVHIATLSIETTKKWREDSAFNEILLQSISRKFLTKSMTLSFHLLHEADVRFASYIASVTHDEQGILTNSLIPKKELKTIAEFIGITVRHQNRCIQSFERDQIIKRIPGYIEIIDSKRLLNYAKQNIYEMQ